MGSRTALITGITGQDGSFLAEYLQARGYSLHGLFRPGEPMTAGLQAGPIERHEADLTDSEAVSRAFAGARPDECYHLAAQTFVGDNEHATVRANIEGTLNVLDGIRREAPGCRLFLAGSSEMFGSPESSPQDENTPFRPRNVYGVTKVAAWQLMDVYRQQHGLFGCCGILYNHESPRRPVHFVTRKITHGAAQIRNGKQTELRLGNLDAVRDWGHARDYVRAMWLMLQQPAPDDYVIATGEPRTVRQFVEAAFRAAGLEWEPYVRVDPQFFRPAEKVPLVGCAAKARQKLGWVPETSFTELLNEMVAQDLAPGAE